MNRRGLLATATALPLAGTAGCVGTLTELRVEVTHHDNPRNAPETGVPLVGSEDATLVDAWSVGEPSDGDTAPVHVGVLNAAPETRDCSVRLTVNGTARIDADVSLDADEYVRVTLFTPRNYVATVGHRPDRRSIDVERDRFDCNEKSIAASVAVDGTVQTHSASTDVDSSHCLSPEALYRPDP